MNGLRGLIIAMTLLQPVGVSAEGNLSGTLLYRRLTDGTWQIWQTELAVNDRRQLTFSAGDKRLPAWTRDGRIAYHTSNLGYYVMRLREEDRQPLLSTLWPIKDVAWSPDGAWLALTRLETGLVENADLWVADAGGTHRRLMTPEPGVQHHGAWSPDGRRLVYIDDRGYGAHELYLINADGSGRQRLTNNAGREYFPAWSPDGTHIIFTADLDGDYNVWLMNADGTDLKQLTTATGLDTRAAWSPDGRHLAFTTNRTGTLEIWVMQADGTQQRPLEQAAGGVCDPAWR